MKDFLVFGTATLSDLPSLGKQNEDIKLANAQVMKSRQSRQVPSVPEMKVLAFRGWGVALTVNRSAARDLPKLKVKICLLCKGSFRFGFVLFFSPWRKRVSHVLFQKAFSRAITKKSQCHPGNRRASHHGVAKRNSWAAVRHVSWLADRKDFISGDKHRDQSKASGQKNKTTVSLPVSVRGQRSLHFPSRQTKLELKLKERMKTNKQTPHRFSSAAKALTNSFCRFPGLLQFYVKSVFGTLGVGRTLRSSY